MCRESARHQLRLNPLNYGVIWGLSSSQQITLAKKEILCAFEGFGKERPINRCGICAR
jgi:hypothetical protein